MAIDPLLAHVGDTRYAFSVNFGDRDYNVTVSRACEMIAERILLAFDPEIHFLTRDQYDVYPSDRDPKLSFAKWWQQNKQRGLQTLQLQAIDAMIAFMTNVDGRKALSVHPYAEQYAPRTFDRLRKENLNTLNAMRRFIIEKGEPYRPKSLDDRNNYLFGLPWTTRRHSL